MAGDIILESTGDIWYTFSNGQDQKGTDMMFIMGKYTIEDYPGCVMLM